VLWRESRAGPKAMGSVASSSESDAKRHETEQRANRKASLRD